MLSASDMLNALPGDKAAVRRYVTAAPTTSLSDGTVAINVTHSNLKQFVKELRFDLHSTIGEVKQRLYTFNGSATSAMELRLLDSSGAVLARMLDEDRPLGYYGVCSGMTVHVVDNDLFSLSRDGGLDDVSRIAKYSMSDEDYDKREKSYRAFKREQQAKNPGWRPPHLKASDEAAAAAYSDPTCVAGFDVGLRCAVSPGERRGAIAYVGPIVGLAPGFWVGVRLDEPLGRHDGTYDDAQYFVAEPKCGAFVRPGLVTLGDFPPMWEVEGLGGADADAAAAARVAAAGSAPLVAGEGGEDDDRAVIAGVAGEGGGACCNGGGGHAHGASTAAPAAGASGTARPYRQKRRGELDSDDDEL